MNSNIYDFIRIRGGNKHKSKNLTSKRSESVTESNVLTWNTNSFVITGAPTRFINDNETPNGKKIIRVAFIASKKTISKLATVRNYVKRKLRSVVNDNIREQLSNTYDYIFIAKHNMIDLPYSDLCDQFIWACKHFNRMIDSINLQKDKNDV